MKRFTRFGWLAVLVLLLDCVSSNPAPTALSTLSSLQVQKLNKYAEATVRYFTSAEANNKEVGFTHAFFGTGKFQVYRNGQWQEENWDLTRGYGSHVNINEVTLRFLSLAAAYKMGWLRYLPQNDQYAESWGQILTGLQTLRTMQTLGDHRQFDEGHFHRSYLTTITRDGQYDVDRHAYEIIRPEREDMQSSDDNALPFMNLLVLEGLASDPRVAIPDRDEIINLSREIRGAIDLQGFIVGDAIAHAIENGVPSRLVWDRVSAEGAIILAALLLSDQITEGRFEQLALSLKNSAVGWTSFYQGIIDIGKPSYHAAMFIHGLRAIHGMPVTAEEFSGLNYFVTSTEPVLEAQMDFAQHYGYSALGSQVMTQELYGIPLYEMNGEQVRFPGNESKKMPIPRESLSRATGPHAWLVPLQRWRYLDQDDINRVFDWVARYESEFFHAGSDTQLGWEAAIPWTPNDTTYAWKASDGTWRYTDWGRPYEALNAAYIVLSIFDALNPDAPLASYNVEANRLQRIAFYLDNNGTWPVPPAVRNVDPSWCGQKIAFVSDRDGNWEIYTMNSDFTNQTRLTYNSADDISPGWSSDCQKIAFVSNRDGVYKIYVMNANGTNQNPITGNISLCDSDLPRLPTWSSPTWSPDSNWIAFTGEEGHTSGGDPCRGNIYRVHPDGTGIERKTGDPGGNSNDVEPAWPPLGDKIVYSTNRSGKYGLAWMDAETGQGSGFGNIITSGSLCPPGYELRHGQPSWSPDGQYIAFGDMCLGKIHTIKPDRTSDRILTEGFNPDWSSDGQRIVYDTGSEIRIISLPTPEVFRVTREGNIHAAGAFYCGLGSPGQVTPPAAPCYNVGNADIAERIDTSEPVTFGDVLEIDPQHPEQYRKVRELMSTLVAGVVSLAPGFALANRPEELTERVIDNRRPLIQRGLLSSLLQPQIPSSHWTISTLTHPPTSRISLAQVSEVVERWQKQAQNPTTRPLLALMGRVPVKAATENGPIQPGDLLVSSSTPGHVMRCSDPKECEGAVIGKALAPLETGTGLILMLVMR